MANRQDRGFALLIVLWWTGLAGAGRLEAKRSGNLRDAAVAEAAAEGALQEAAFHLLASGQAGWAIDGTIHTLPLTGGTASIIVCDEAAKIGLIRPPPGCWRRC